jgi:hypothetical protein
MNERIKELAHEAGLPTYNPQGIPTKLEKFAELIVRECVNVGLEQKKWVEDMEVFNEQDATWNRARIQQSQQIVDKIKQHFGVEC